jgi:hypothetical protein
MSKKRRLHILRKLAIGPAAIIAAIIFAVLSLLGLLNFNPPSVTDSSTDAPDEQAEMTGQQARVAVAIKSADPEQAAGVAQPATLAPLEVVDVVIDGDVYWVGTGKQNDTVVRQPRTIGEIIQACGQSEGDPSGVRIRVTRTFEATARAERALVSALTDAGLTDDEIDVRRTLVQRPNALTQ